MVLFMCLVAVAWRVDSQYPLVVLANRDEFFERPSAVLAQWEDHPDILAGRDLRAGGTWLGFNRSNRRFAVVTNVREPGAALKAPARSRGFLIPDFLLGELNAEEFAQNLLDETAQNYDGYNLMLFDENKAVCVSNRGGLQHLQPGVYGLSNAQLDTPWPKVESAKAGLHTALEQSVGVEALEQVMRDAQQVSDEKLPSTGVPLEWERRLSAMFIDGSSEYGTRALTSVRINTEGLATLREWSRMSFADPWQLHELTA